MRTLLFCAAALMLAKLSLANVTEQPDGSLNAVVTAGKKVTFSVTASGSPAPSFQWRKNGFAIPGATTSSYTINSTTLADAGVYTAVAANSLGSALSNSAVLVVNPLVVETSPPSITTQPVSQVVASGGAATFSVAATGTGTTYQWMKNGAPISGATSPTLTLSGISSGDVATYTVLVTNSVGSLLSAPATLTLSAPAGTAPMVTISPASSSVAAGSSVTFTAAASGSPAPTFQWRKNGAPIAGATNSTLTLGSVSSNDNGTYTVVAQNAFGSATSNGATLTVTAASGGGGGSSAPAIATQPASQSASLGSTVSFSVGASGGGLNYQWMRNDAAIAGANGSTLTLSNISTKDYARYNVVVWNASGWVVSAHATLSAGSGAPAPAPVAPTVSVSPSTHTASTGGSVTFVGTVTGSPAPSLQWFKDGSALSGATGSTLYLSSLSTGHSGSYTLVATNSAGSRTSNAATLTVTPTAPVATAPTVSVSPGSHTAMTGGSVTFVATATGNPAPTLQWFRNGSPIGGATGATLSLSSLTTGHSGTYLVVATNSAGAASSNVATLTVTAPAPTAIAPTISVSPGSRTVTTGTNVSFTATVTGTPAPSLQWFKNGSPLPGATVPTLNLFAVGAADAATYVAVATNSAGSASSNAVTLTVTTPLPAAPTISISPSSHTGMAGTSATFTATVGGSASLQWYKNGAAIPGATGSTLTFGSLAASDAATYVAVATNAGGSAASNAATLTVTPAPAPSAPPPSSAVTLPAFAQQLVKTPAKVLLAVGAPTRVDFTVSGSGPRKILVRVLGPGLSAFGFSDPLADPKLDLFQAGANIAQNDNWGGSSTLMQAFARSGAFPIADGASKDAVLFLTLSPGTYSAVLSSGDGSTGVVLFETYDVP